ncbi:hypothetical protein GDO81_029574 [Engystomops pustulosus]|uniref:Secreted protein n=1 Tax=Engystomops pustulosus TaxID=76066 RepID=A0AAV6YFZ5_ENGPU|nr:hypothetical protein GDO81_029574 [Engystomops pustulosus]
MCGGGALTSAPPLFLLFLTIFFLIHFKFFLFYKYDILYLMSNKASNPTARSSGCDWRRLWGALPTDEGLHSIRSNQSFITKIPPNLQGR